MWPVDALATPMPKAERDEVLGDGAGRADAGAAAGADSRGWDALEFWGGWEHTSAIDDSLADQAKLPKASSEQAGYFDGFSSTAVLQESPALRRTGSGSAPSPRGGGGMEQPGERLRGAVRIGGGGEGKRSADVLCSRDGDGNAGYRVTLHQLEVCELNEDSVGYANGLRNNQRVTHVDHQPVSNWEEYRDRAHGRDSFVLTVALPAAAHYEGMDASAFVLESCAVPAADAVGGGAGKSGAEGRGAWLAVRCCAAAT